MAMVIGVGLEQGGVIPSGPIGSPVSRGIMFASIKMLSYWSVVWNITLVSKPKRTEGHEDITN